MALNKPGSAGLRLASYLGSGAGEGTRTTDPIITNDVLYQLSYTGVPARLLARIGGEG